MNKISTSDSYETITLLVENRRIICSKHLLTKNSYYFNAMFTHKYREYNETIIRLKEVDGHAMEDLILVLMDEGYYPKITNICEVITLSDMFLFDDLKEFLMSQTMSLLSSENCLAIWMNLKLMPLYPLLWKAKSLSLTEFHDVILTDSFKALTLSEVVTYLGHRNLQCKKESDVFLALLKWFESNNKTIHDAPFEEILRFVINFNDITLPDLKTIRFHNEISKYANIVRILDNLIKIKSGKKLLKSDIHSQIAQSWIDCPGRYLPKYLCVLDIKQKVEIFYHGRTQDPFLKKVLTISSKFENLVGFAIQVYRTKIYIIGGEFHMGTGVWNQSIFEFDWDRKKLIQSAHFLPFKRRHFNSCVIKDTLYIIGGTGPHRVKANNIHCFNFETGKWRPQPIKLPCQYVPSKYCDYEGQLFILDCDSKCGYYYINEENQWIIAKISDSVDLTECHNSSVFSYKGKLYLKGNKLVELTYDLKASKIVATAEHPLPNYIRGRLLETTISHNRVYSFYVDDLTPDVVRLEYLDLDNLTSYFYPKLGLFQELIKNSKKNYYLSQYYGANLEYSTESMMKMFMYYHRDLIVSEDILEDLGKTPWLNS